MSLIKNLVREPETKEKSKTDSGSDSEHKPRNIIKSAIDLQRLKLEKLMKNPEKPVIIPEKRREKDYMQSVPTFVRNVMGSSAGAGSGEFHVYRHLRRKEYARQKMIQSKSTQELLDDEYQQKLEDNRRTAEEKTAKKRAKRLKKKQRAKRPRQQNESNDNTNSNKDESSGEESAEENVLEQTAVVKEDQNPETKNDSTIVESSAITSECNKIEPLEIKNSQSNDEEPSEKK